MTTVNEPFQNYDLPPAMQQYTAVVLLTGMGLVIYAVSTFAAQVIESGLEDRFKGRRIRKMIERLHGHLIVAGAGKTGEVIIGELNRRGEPFVIIEIDQDRVEELRSKLQQPVVQGDATDDDVLREAGIDRASGIFAALPGDQENLFVVISVNELNPEVKIVARSIDPRTDEKLRRAGAGVVIAPTTIGADRMVSAMIRPKVVTFMDRLLRDPESTSRIEEVEIGAASELDGVTISEADLGARTQLLVLALQHPGEHLACNPAASEKLTAGTLLVVLGDVSHFPKLHQLAAARSPGVVPRG
ncbi:MAG TPA: hypothetical protein EYN00_05870 [Planctomycetes bacterium]|nr:hypothetical protein [Planctomycetota bacterium]